MIGVEGGLLSIIGAQSMDSCQSGVKNKVFIIIGAQKSGTTALFSYLSKHPNICPSKRKEVDFFCTDLSCQRGEAWYQQQFIDKECNAKMEASPLYLMSMLCSGSVAKRIYSFNPDIKLIAILRDPVKRAYSAWNMYRRISRDNVDSIVKSYTITLDKDARSSFRNYLLRKPFPSFADTIAEEMDILKNKANAKFPCILRTGRDYEHLKEYFDLFPRENLHILESNDLKDNRAKALDTIVNYLELELHNWNIDDLNEVAKGNYESEIDDQTYSKLVSFFQPHNQETSSEGFCQS